MLNIKGRKSWILFIYDYTIVKISPKDDKLLSIFGEEDFE